MFIIAFIVGNLCCCPSLMHSCVCIFLLCASCISVAAVVAAINVCCFSCWFSFSFIRFLTFCRLHCAVEYLKGTSTYNYTHAYIHTHTHISISSALCVVAIAKARTLNIFNIRRQWNHHWRQKQRCIFNCMNYTRIMTLVNRWCIHYVCTVIKFVHKKLIRNNDYSNGYMCKLSVLVIII